MKGYITKNLIVKYGFCIIVKLSEISKIILKKPLDEYLKSYLRPRSGTTSNLTLDYITETNHFAINVKIRNLDGTNTLTYSFNALGQNITVPAGGTDTISDSPIQLLQIIPHGTTGNFIIEAQGIKMLELI